MVWKHRESAARMGGYRPSLDSIKVFSTTRYVTKIITEESEPP